MKLACVACALAVVDPRAIIGEGCEIGPFCIVGPDVILGTGNMARQHALAFKAEKDIELVACVDPFHADGDIAPTADAISAAHADSVFSTVGGPMPHRGRSNCCERGNLGRMTDAPGGSLVDYMNTPHEGVAPGRQ
jgi:hypothetical protein